MADPTNIIHFTYYDTTGTTTLDDRLTYTYPEGKIVLDLTYLVPGYPDVTARWKVFQADSPIPQPVNENEMSFGFLITSYSNTVHEVSTLDSRFRWNPHMNMLYGTLECNYLIELLYDMDKNGSTVKNPSVVIDPSRYTGLNRDHPFVKALLSIPLVRLDKMLRDLDTSISAASVQLDDFNEILQEIEQYGIQLFNNLPIKLEWQPTYDGNLVKAILDDRVNYTVSERSFAYANTGSNVDPNYKKQSNDWVAMNDSSIVSQIKLATSSANGTKIYAINNSGVAVGINSDIDVTSINFNPDDLKTFYDDVNSQIDTTLFTQHPYIYSINTDGDLVKLFIFEKGQLGSLTDNEQNTITDATRTIRITFTKDINISYRYTIDLSSGIVIIKINLNNPIVGQYLLSNNNTFGTTIDASDVTFDISNFNGIGNNKSFIFLSELFTEIFAKIILLGKSMTGNVMIADTSTTMNVNKVYSHYEQIVTAIEKPINAIFTNYYKQNTTKMIKSFNDLLAEKVTDPTLLTILQNDVMNNLTNLF